MIISTGLDGRRTQKNSAGNRSALKRVSCMKVVMVCDDKNCGLRDELTYPDVLDRLNQAQEGSHTVA